MIRRKVLVLSYTREDVIRSLPYLRKLRHDGAAVVILGIDFGSWAELRRRNMRFKTPADYLDKSKCAKIDAQAVALACSWYEPIRDEITYHGVCLGEMAEYDFRFLFLDGLRAIEIARCIVSMERPDSILLSPHVPAALPAITVRYEALQNAITYMAKSEGIQFSYINSGPEKSFAPAGPSARLVSFSGRLLSKARGTLRSARSLMRLHEHLDVRQSRCTAAFFGVPNEIFLPIKNELDRNSRVLAVRMDASLFRKQRRHTSAETVAMIDRCRAVQEKGHFGRDLTYATARLAEILAPRFSRFFLEECPELVRWMEATETFIRQARPSLLVTMQDVTPMVRLITRVCKRHGIPALVIQHGMDVTDTTVHPIMPVEADLQAVWGNVSKEWAIKRGKSPESQVITGNPRYDFIAHRIDRPDEARITLSRELGLKAGVAVVVIATMWYASHTCPYTPENDEAFMRDTLAAMKNFPEVQTVVKLHPYLHTECDAIARAIADELKASVVITARFLWELLETCDLLITDISTTAVEAILHDKPVIRFNPDPGLNPNAYAETKSIIKAHSKVELVRAIKDVLYNSDVRRELALARKQSVGEYACNQDGKASQRVAELVEAMVFRRSSGPSS